MPQFLRFDPASCHFPRPRVPLLPALRLGELGLGSAGGAHRTVLDGPSVHHFSRGRYALRAAYELAGVGPLGTLLAPAYHCRTMLDPALALGARVSFYQTYPDLAPDVDSVLALIGAGAVPPKALIVPHYFGVEQPAAVMRELASLCAAHGIRIVEDCSHAWQVAARRAGDADSSHIVVASPYKFFPCEDGGVLWASGPVSPPTPPALIDEIKGLKSAWSRSRRRTPHLDVAAPAAGSHGLMVTEESDHPSGMYQRSLERCCSLAASRWIMGHTPVEPIIARRRENYEQWLRAIEHVSDARPLYPDLPADCAPYMFPLEIGKPAPSFYQLKQAGMPIWRWDDMAVTQCPAANRYRLHLLHLPCHQDLTTADMEWMTSLVRKVLS